MKQVIFGIFAHPDDESFGPGGYLLKMARSGTDVHLVVVTDGENGHNDEGHEDLGKVRHQEWLESGRRLGAASNYALHYPDGGLCNNYYLRIASEIISHIKQTVDNYDQNLKIDFVTFEERGITGHLDHIAVSYITTYIYEKLKQSPIPNTVMGTLRYYCITEEVAPAANCNWLYMPPGRSSSEVHDVVDYSEIYEDRLHVMKAHTTQHKDLNGIIKKHTNDKGEVIPEKLRDHFIVKDL